MLDLDKKMEEVVAEFEKLTQIANETRKRLTKIDEETLRLQGEYRLLESMKRERDGEAPANPDESASPIRNITKV